MSNRLLHHVRIAGGTELVAPHEFCISERVPTVPLMSSGHRKIQWPVHRTRYLLCYIARQFSQPLYVESAFPRPAGRLGLCVEQRERKLPLPLRHLHRTMHDKTNSHAARNFGRRNIGVQAQDRGYRQDINILKIPQQRDQRVSKSQAYSPVIGSLSDQPKRQYHERSALAPMALALPGVRLPGKLPIIATILRVNDAYRTDEPVALAHNGFNKAGPFRVVTQGSPNLTHHVVEIPFRIDEQVRAPKLLDDVIA